MLISPWRIRRETDEGMALWDGIVLIPFWRRHEGGLGQGVLWGRFPSMEFHSCSHILHPGLLPRRERRGSHSWNASVQPVGSMAFPSCSRVRFLSQPSDSRQNCHYDLVSRLMARYFSSPCLVLVCFSDVIIIPSVTGYDVLFRQSISYPHQKALEISEPLIKMAGCRLYSSI